MISMKGTLINLQAKVRAFATEPRTRMEQTEGFDPSRTPVALVGDTLVVKLSDDLSFLSPFEIDRTHKYDYDRPLNNNLAN